MTTVWFCYPLLPFLLTGQPPAPDHGWSWDVYVFICLLNDVASFPAANLLSICRGEKVCPALARHSAGQCMSQGTTDSENNSLQTLQKLSAHCSAAAYGFVQYLVEYSGTSWPTHSNVQPWLLQEFVGGFSRNSFRSEWLSGSCC